MSEQTVTSSIPMEKRILEIRLEVLEIHGSLDTAISAVCAFEKCLDTRIKLRELAGRTAWDVICRAAAGVVDWQATDAAKSVARDSAVAAKLAAAKEGKDQSGIAEATCRSVMKDWRNIRTVIVARFATMKLEALSSIVASVRRLLTYDKAELSSLKDTVPVQLLYILYRFDRVATMTEDKSLAREFAALVDSLSYTARYQALYQPTVACRALTKQARLPKELVGLVADYCRLYVLALEDEELIINRILE